MKKKFLVLLAALSVMTALCGCSKDKVEVSEDINPDDYVTIGDYEGIDVEVEMGTVSENAIEQQMQMELDYYITQYQIYDYDQITDRDVVQTGDMVNIDYEGKKDGVAFSGGTAKGAYLEIGSGSFINGFEDGLIGVKVNETVDLNLTFPEDYTNQELAGQAVVFTVSVNGIYDAASQRKPAYDDALIERMNQYGLGFPNMEQYREDVIAYLEEQQAILNEDLKTNLIWEAVFEKCEVKQPPQEMVDRIKQRVYDNAQQYADQYSMDLNTFIEQGMQTTVEAFEEQALAAAVESAEDILLVKAIAKEQGIVISKKQLQELKETEAAAANKTAEEYFAGVSDEDFYEYALTKQVYEYLATVVNVIEK